MEESGACAGPQQLFCTIGSKSHRYSIYTVRFSFAFVGLCNALSNTGLASVDAFRVSLESMHQAMEYV